MDNLNNSNIKKNWNSKNIVNESISIGIESLLSKFIYNEKFLNVIDNDTSYLIQIINIYREIL